MGNSEVMTPVPVYLSDDQIKNWADAVKPPLVKNTTLRTYIVNPADANAKNVQITDFEPKRYRMAIYVVDVAVTLLAEPPITSPDTTTASTAPQGAYLPPALTPYVFYGPDAFWLNALTAVTRVVVVKEYC